MLVLPDYKIVNNVEPTLEGAQKLWASAMDPSLGRAGSAAGDKGLRTWVLPYSCVILLCTVPTFSSSWLYRETHET